MMLQTINVPVARLLCVLNVVLLTKIIEHVGSTEDIRQLLGGITGSLLET